MRPPSHPETQSQMLPGVPEQQRRLSDTWRTGSEALKASGRAVWRTATQERYRKRPEENGEEAQKEMLNHWKAFIQEKRDWRGNTAAFKGKNFGAHTRLTSVWLPSLLLLMPVWVRWVLPALRTGPGGLQSWPCRPLSSPLPHTGKPVGTRAPLPRPQDSCKPWPSGQG